MYTQLVVATYKAVASQAMTITTVRNAMLKWRALSLVRSVAW